MFQTLNGGQPGPFVIGRAPWDVVRHLGASNNRVLLYPSTGPKLLAKHNIDLVYYNQLPLALRYGWMGKDKDKHLCFIFNEPFLFDRKLKVVLKTDHTRTEIILVTMHKIADRDEARHKKRCAKIRDHLKIEEGP